MSGYYRPCKELDECVKLDAFWETKQFEKWFDGYRRIAEETHYPLAECQLGYCYLEGIGTKKDIERAVFWTLQAAEHGDRDAQYNMGCIYESGLVPCTDEKDAGYWHRKAAQQGHDLAMEKLRAATPDWTVQKTEDEL